MSVSKWATGLVAVLVFVGGAAVGRSVTPAKAPLSVAEDAHPLSDGKRYKVPVSLSQPYRGDSAALVTVVEWCDARGARCRDFDATIDNLLHRYAGNLRHVWRHLPSEASEESRLAHEFVRIAHEQAGMFWQARALLLNHKSTLTEADLPGFAAQLGMDYRVVARALADHSHAGYVAADGLFASKFGVTDSPTVFVNGRRLLGTLSEHRLASLIDSEIVAAQALLKEGVAVDKVYDELTGDGLWDAPSSPLAKTP